MIYFLQLELYKFSSDEVIKHFGSRWYRWFIQIAAALEKLITYYIL